MPSRSRFPLRSSARPCGGVVVDPLLTTFAVDTASQDQSYPDVAYDATTDHYTYVYEDRFSGTDNDIFRTTLTSSGTFAHSGYIDGSSANWY
ncbi:hypothetical protein Poly30_18060 [Planctomycetes bacterium Poly30]|uniref:Uncharacterized protein n=1 Tax=Saltatorellus ferox TaxID=2528018 RepID=A0A518EQC6_9BACT|nr:hypothetical protein Poly30_18060 [Planctomycetes bacterium Poly30]